MNLETILKILKDYPKQDFTFLLRYKGEPGMSPFMSAKFKEHASENLKDLNGQLVRRLKENGMLSDSIWFFVHLIIYFSSWVRNPTYLQDMIGREKQAQDDKIDYEKEVDAKAKAVREKDEAYKDMVDDLIGEVRELKREVRELKQEVRKLKQEVRERDKALKAEEKELRRVGREKDEVISKPEKKGRELEFSVERLTEKNMEQEQTIMEVIILPYYCRQFFNNCPFSASQGDNFKFMDNI